MSEPILAYETPVTWRRSGLRTATWIVLLVLGTLYGLGGLGVGVAGGIAVASIGGSGVGWERALVPFYIVGVIIFASVGLAIGSTYLVSSWGVKRGSRGAAILALVVALLNAGVLLVLSGFWVRDLVMEGGVPGYIGDRFGDGLSGGRGGAWGVGGDGDGAAEGRAVHGACGHDGAEASHVIQGGGRRGSKGEEGSRKTKWVGRGEDSGKSKGYFLEFRDFLGAGNGGVRL